MNRIPQQILPLVLMLLLTIAALIVARTIMIPDTFGDLGHYRADAIGDVAALELTYAGSRACNECHDDIFELKQQSHHEGVSCEVCHGPGVEHIEAPDEHQPRIPRGRGYCPLCHEYNPARPTGFPQIIERLHNPGQPCMSCHDPHNPLLPHAPEDCSACHREIALEKSLSHHTTLACTRCHDVDEGHMTSPRTVRAGKPQSSELCGECHDTNADSPQSIPRIELVDHTGRYNCWDCHYPHHPEAN